ncbi:MAG: hypothetical protein ISS48_04190 [Candidatus Aenigmarchaeota archaeon]|nr:hypothetical protein [Candidatus Aenigmarchaeota archaeon]
MITLEKSYADSPEFHVLIVYTDFPGFRRRAEVLCPRVGRIVPVREKCLGDCKYFKGWEGITKGLGVGRILCTYRFQGR